MADNDKLNDFFAKKKGKKKFGSKDKKTTKSTESTPSNINASSEDHNEQSTSNAKCDESGWIEIQQEKKNVIQTAGKTLAELGNLAEEEEQSVSADAEKDDTKNMFHWARNNVKKKVKKLAEQSEESSAAPPAGSLRRLQARQAGISFERKLQVDSERQFPSLGGAQTSGKQPPQQVATKPIEVHNAWSKFTAESDSEDDESSKKKQDKEPEKPISVTTLKDALPSADQSTRQPQEEKLVIPVVDEAELARFAGMKKKKKKTKPAQ